MRRSGLVCAVVVSLVAGACAFDASGSAGGDAGGIDIDAAPAIDAAGDIDARPTCSERCEGAELVECVGGVEQRSPCDMGCSESGGPHCGELVPSNGVTSDALAGVTEGLRVPEDTTAVLEADSGRIVVDGSELRGPGEGVIGGIRFVGGPPYNVFVLDRIEVARGATLLIRAPSSAGGVASPLILYVRRDVEINGLVDITARCTDGAHWCAGVGGGNGGTADYLPQGCAPGGPGKTETLSEDTGGGGGGLGQNGAPGGDSADLAGGTGGDTADCPGPSLVPLDGGSGGELGGNGGDGGGGGGALQISARELIRIRPAGAGVTPGIWAGGAGGEGGGIGNGGGGGGSGGAILLEAPVVDVRSGAILAANGGGGGEGDGSGSGQDGLLANAPAGGGGGTVVRHGGKGGFGTTAPEPGDGPGDGTGGGGGGAGIIRVNANSASLGGVSSPPPTTGSLTIE